MKIRVTLVFNLKHDNIGKIKMQVKTLLKFENVFNGKTNDSSYYL